MCTILLLILAQAVAGSVDCPPTLVAFAALICFCYWWSFCCVVYAFVTLVARTVAGSAVGLAAKLRHGAPVGVLPQGQMNGRLPRALGSHTFIEKNKSCWSVPK